MSTPLVPGTVLAGKYRVERVLGEGAMGVVLLAHHLQLDERVAIKIPLREALGSPEAIARFLREARAAVKIKSEHVARVSDVGTLESGEPFIVMEYLEGQDLAAWLEARGSLPVEQAAEFMLQACEALAEAHSLGIVHRDLKPANLFCVRRADGLFAVKVLDFGISKVGPQGAGAEASMTKVGAVMGSPLYMSPEQLVSSREVDARSDIWALGVSLFELVCGHPPFSAETLVGLGVQIAHGAPAPVRAFRLDVPEGLERVVLRCLEKDRTRRYANVAELAQALFEFAPKRARASVERIARVIQTAGLSQRALELPPVSEAPGAAQARSGHSPEGFSRGAPERTQQTFGHTASPALPRPKSLLVLGLLGVSTLGVAGGAWLWSRRAPPESIVPERASAVPAQEVLAPKAQNPATTHVAPAPQPSSASTVDTSSAPASPAPSAETAPPTVASALRREAPRPRAPTQIKPNKPPQPPAAPSPARAKPDCDPNYYYDAHGEKHFKPQCF